MPPHELAVSFEVLVVDDEPEARELLIEYFRSLGFRVSGAADGRAAISVLQRSFGSFGLVVTDLNLPGADGFAVLQAARQANPACYVVIVTGYASLDSAIHAVRVGAYDYLTKPFTLGQLDVVLARIQDRARLEGENRRLRPGPTVTASIGPAAPAVELLPASPSGAWDLERRVSALERSLARIETLLENR
jgi:DNA-binding NtrC family response regulator